MSTHPSPRHLLVIDEPLKSRGELDLMAEALHRSSGVAGSVFPAHSS